MSIHQIWSFERSVTNTLTLCQKQTENPDISSHEAIHWKLTRPRESPHLPESNCFPRTEDPNSLFICSSRIHLIMKIRFIPSLMKLYLLLKINLYIHEHACVCMHAYKWQKWKITKAVVLIYSYMSIYPNLWQTIRKWEETSFEFGRVRNSA